MHYLKTTTVLMLTLICVGAHAEEYPVWWSKDAPVEELLQKTRADEDWLWEAESVYLKAEGVLRKKPGSVAFHRAELERENPGIDFDDRRNQLEYWDILPEVHEELLVAWDSNHIAKAELKKGIYSSRQIFDGEEVLTHFEDLVQHSEYYAKDRDLHKNLTALLLGDFAIARNTHAKTWWSKQREDYEENRAFAETDYGDQGIQVRDGKSYRVLKRRTPTSQELWIDCETNQLTYIKSLFRLSRPNEANDWAESMQGFFMRLEIQGVAEVLLEEDPEAFACLKSASGAMALNPEWPSEEALSEISEKMMSFMRSLRKDPENAAARYWEFLISEDLAALEAGTDFTFNRSEFEKALREIFDTTPEFPEHLSEVRQKHIDEYASTLDSPYAKALSEQPFAEQVMKDWREVLPGKWFPFEQGYTFWFHEFDMAGTVNFIREISVKELRIDEPLPDELFQMQMKEGVKVHDWGHDPPLHYKYKKDFSKDEWNEIVREAEAQASENNLIKSRQEELIGKPAQQFYVSKWFQGGPHKMESLKGKNIVLDFFAEWCAPCRNAYPGLASLWDRCDPKKTIVIGIHTPGSNEGDISKIVEQYNLDYPIFIDQPNGVGSSWGMTFDAYKIHGIPHAVLIDSDGNVAAHGHVGEVIRKLNELEQP